MAAQPLPHRKETQLRQLRTFSRPSLPAVHITCHCRVEHENGRIPRVKRALALAVLCCAPWCAKSQIPVNEAVGGVAVNAPAPGYPITARRNHWTGAGIFICKGRPDGTVSSVDVRQSTGHEILDQAAIAALRQWRFKMRAVIL